MLTFNLPEGSPGLNVSMEAAPLYEPYFRKYGVWRAVQLALPKLNKLENLVLPRNTILHYLPEDEIENGISQTHPLVKNTERLLMIEHVQQLATDVGTPRRNPIPPTSLINPYRRANRRTREISNIDATMRDPMLTVIINYALLGKLYRYPTNFFRNWYRWTNIQNTLWKRVGELGKAYPARNQFLSCHLPTILPTLNLLRRGEVGMTRNLLPNFLQPESLFILEVWRWLGVHRKSSVLAQAAPEDLAKMNLIFIEQDRWLILNLGLLDQWRKRPDDEEGSATHGGVLEPLMLQKRFLRVLMTLMEVRTGVDDSQVNGPAGEIGTASVLTGDSTDPNTGEAEYKVTTVARAEPVKLIIPNEDGTTSKVKLTANLNLDKLPENLVEETPENAKLIDDAITKDLDALEHVAARYAESLNEEGEDSPIDTATSEVTAMIKYEPQTRTLAQGVMDQVDQLADAGLVSGAEYRRMTALSTAYQRLPNPFGEGTLESMMEITKEDLALNETVQFPDSSTIPDKSMLRSTVTDFDAQYLNKVYRKDLTRTVLSVQNAGYAVTNFDMEEHRDALNRYEKFSLQLTPAVGKQSTVYFKLPKVETDGTYIDNGSRYRARIQRGDLPIRKVSPSKVSLTSYYGRTSVNRSERQVANYPGWLTNQIAVMAASVENTKVAHAMISDVFDSEVRTPRVYSIMATRFRSFHVNLDDQQPYQFFFDYHARKAEFGTETVESLEKDGLVAVGKQGDKIMLVDNTNTFYLAEGMELTTIGTMESLLDITSPPPAEIAEIRIFGKQIPVGIFLAYQLGLTELFKLLGITPRRIPTGTRLNLADDEMVIRFEDEAWAFPYDSSRRTLILAGLASYEKYTRDYSAHLFDRKDVYLNVLDKAHIGVRYLREMDLMRDMFVDPITLDILEGMGEPTEFIGLVLRSCELLETDWSPLETDMAYMRLKGYERFSGAVYSELVKAIRQHRARGTMANQKVDLHPDAVWIGLSKDSVKKSVEESNPVHNMREREEVTYSGVGGRSGRSMVGRTRVFHPNDMGVISESTKDSGDVAITTFMVADPTLTDVRGMTRRFDKTKDGAASIMSSPALLSPGADRDDGKRVNFIPIQHSSSTFAKGYKPTPLRTGYESIVAHRCDRMFAATAKVNGKVTMLSDKGMQVSYEDGTSDSIQLGRRFGKAGGVCFPHQLDTQFKMGDDVKKGDVLAYNARYFSPDPLVPNQVLWKAGLVAKVAIMENANTLEDSSEISAEIADKLETEFTTVRDIVVSFDQVVHRLVEPGDAVDIDSILCTIEDAVTAETNLFNEQSLDMLQLIAANTPRAKQRGTVEKVEVFYHGDIADMSESLQLLASKSDRERKRLAKALNEPVLTGQVDSSTRIQSKPLPADNMVIRIYITGPVAAGVGDKIVFANQMKSVIGGVMVGENRTASGEPIDAIFSYQSIANRIVRSPELIGVANILLRLITQRVVKAYYGN